MQTLTCFVSFLLLSLSNPNDAARILGVFPMAAPSHYILGSALMRGLADAGHDITLISPYTQKNPPKNGKWREIFLDGFVEAQQEKMKSFNMFELESINPLLTFFVINTMGSEGTADTLAHPKVKELMNSKEKFDIVIVGQFFNDGMNALANHFNAHLILFSNVPAYVWNNHLVGNPSLPSFSPEVLLNYPLKMTFLQRVKNTLFKFVHYLNYNLIFYPSQNEIVKKHISDTVDLSDSLYNASLILLNSDVSLSYPRAHVPNMIEIGGFHIEPPKKLPEDLQKFLDDSKEGVIYFSLGSNLKSKDLPAKMRKELLTAFGKRKEKVLWKWEDEVLPDQPSNVHVNKWLPQRDLLAHHNIKVFITHGGYLSSTEAVYHGVPIISIPVYGDQKANAFSAQELGYGLVLPFQEINEEKLTSLLDEILHNPKYRENAKERSRILHDKQVKPMDKAVYWVEYVLRHNGAKHLRVPYLHLMWYQYYLLDVFAFIFGGITLFLFISINIFKFVCCRISKTKLKKA